MHQLANTSIIAVPVTLTAGAAAATALNGDVIDMQGLEGALIIIALGAIVAGAATSVKLQHGEVSTGAQVLTDAADIAGSNHTILDTDDNTLVVYDVRKPLHRYLRVAISRATQNATLGVTVIGYGDRYQPTAQPAGNALVVIANPVTGTA